LKSGIIDGYFFQFYLWVNYTHISDYCKTSGHYLPVSDYWYLVTGGLVEDFDFKIGIVSIGDFGFL